MKYMNCLICMLMIFAGWGCSDDTIQENKEPMVSTDGGYLFAHMPVYFIQCHVMRFIGKH